MCLSSFTFNLFQQRNGNLESCRRICRDDLQRNSSWVWTVPWWVCYNVFLLGSIAHKTSLRISWLLWTLQVCRYEWSCQGSRTWMCCALPAASRERVLLKLTLLCCLGILTTLKSLPRHNSLASMTFFTPIPCTYTSSPLDVMARNFFSWKVEDQ